MKFLIPFFLAATPALADLPVVERVIATQTGDTWQFDVTVRHGDTGWEHYADGWTILSLDGAELGHRTLAHPHVTEQPFTRSLGGVSIPAGTREVMVHANDSVHGRGEGVVVALD